MTATRKLGAVIYVAGAVVTAILSANERHSSQPAADIGDIAVIAVVAAIWPALYVAVAAAAVNDIYHDQRLPST